MAAKTIRYKCDFCSKIYASKSYCEKEHEPICFHNPASNSCIKCSNLTQEPKYNKEPTAEIKHVFDMLNNHNADVEFRDKLSKYGIFNNVDIDGDDWFFDFFDEYKHFEKYECVPENYCKAQKQFLHKLQTDCSDFNCA